MHMVQTGNQGHPHISIDPVFLQWAYAHWSTSGIAQFLNLNRDTVSNALLDYGIAEAQGASLFGSPAGTSPSGSSDDLLDPEIPQPGSLPSNILNYAAEQPTLSFTRPLSGITDGELDNILVHLCSHYRWAGISMLDGMLWHLGHHLPQERICASLIRIDPIQHVFQRIWIWRRVYSVPGPMSLWHHDGQHGMWLALYLGSWFTLDHQTGLICWGIIIHGFIDGYSRLITSLHASNNNWGETVLDVFLAAAEVYGAPSHIRGDHGIENILLAAWIELHCGRQWGSYIWGRCDCVLSVSNQKKLTNVK